MQFGIPRIFNFALNKIRVTRKQTVTFSWIIGIWDKCAIGAESHESFFSYKLLLNDQLCIQLVA